jgi:Lrp/AsnC family transcriptional regulator, leucine-responsive regulatory protein
VIEVPRVTGDDCFILKAIVPAPEDPATIVDAIGRLGAVTTSVALCSEPAKTIGQGLLIAAGRRRC